MLTNIKTSLANKAVVTELTHKLQLGSENIVARLALSLSLAADKLELGDNKDSKGKEYAPKVLFGANNIPIYIALITQKYELQKTSTDINKYIKLHLDDGLEKLQKEFKKNPGFTSIDFLLPKIEAGLTNF